MIGVLSDSGALVGRQMRHIRRVPTKLLSVTLMPVAYVLLFGYLFGSAMEVPNGSYREFIMAGIFVQMMLSGIQTTALGVTGDLNNGLVDRFRSLPISRVSVLIGRTVSDMALAAITCVVMGGVGYAIGWRMNEGILNGLTGFGLLLLQGLTMSWIGCWIGLALRSVEAVNSVGFVLTFPLAFLSSAFIPLTGLPGWLRTVAEWNPVSAVAGSCRELWGNPGAAASDSFPAQHPIPVAFGSMLILLAIVVPLALRSYRKAVG
ncbi:MULTISPECIES: ABC transporter permease [unclassified Streptomyces]|uniref:ABC transporter permease n=1 Tax=unclassified Streptomyces TaxID=2593676 RepID=UPI0023611DAD|nr:ABC transporter permease [Streptomyces sp. MMBL 11-1]